jgi:isopentenyldiphosphate isomerase
MTCRLNDWEGTVKADSAEVHDWKFGRVSDIQADMELHAQNYTPWFRAEVHAVAAQGPEGT